MNRNEKLMNGVLKGKLSEIDDVLAEHFNDCDNNAQVLIAAKIKFFEAEVRSLEARSIVDILNVGLAANEVIEKSEEEIIFEIVKANKGNERYVSKLRKLKISGDDLVEAYNFSDRNIFHLINIIDFETDMLKSHLKKFNSKGER